MLLPLYNQLGPLAWRRGAAGQQSTLLNGLISAFKLQDANDSHGTNHLTNNNGVTFVAPGGTPPTNMPATVANFVAASNQHLSRFTFTLWPTSDLPSSVAVWVRTSSAATMGIVSQYSNGGLAGFLLAQFGGQVIFDVAPGDFFQNGGAINNGAWHLIIATYDPVTGQGYSYLDNGAGVLSFTRTPAQIGQPWSDSFRLGLYATNYFDGQMSSAYIASRVWTPTERSTLWKNGDGDFYPFTVP